MDVADHLGLFAGAILSLVIFVIVEKRAAEPMLPLRLFRQRVFTVATILSFIVGFAMIGSITFLPTFLQFVAGPLPPSPGCGCSRWCSACCSPPSPAAPSLGAPGSTGCSRSRAVRSRAVGLYLLSLMDQTTPFWLEAIFFLVLGAGIGLCMQILTLIVQNTVDFTDLGTATSGVTFFRTLGRAFGAAVLGSVYANNIADRLPAALAEAPTTPPEAVTSPETLWALPDELRAPFVDAYAVSLHNVFLWAIPVAGLAFFVALLLPQVTLRGTEGAAGAGEGFAMPEGNDLDNQMENVVARVFRQKGRSAAPQILVDVGSSLDNATAWGVTGVFLRHSILGVADQSSIEASVGVPPGVLQSYFDELVAAGWLRRDGEGSLLLTDAGQAEVLKISAGWRDWVIRELSGVSVGSSSDAESSPVQAESKQISAALDRVVLRLIREDELEPALN